MCTYTRQVEEKGREEGRKIIVYECVSDRTFSPETGATKLNISVEQLLGDMAVAGYDIP